MKFDTERLRYILDNMKTIVKFNIKKDGDLYVAEGVDLSIVTEAQNLDDLVKNIDEAVSLYFENENASDFDYSEKPSILVNYELPQHA
jgi:hypothetical protein